MKRKVISALFIGIAIFAASGMAQGAKAPLSATRNSAPESITQAIEKISAEYLGVPYSGGPLGEGPTGKYDQDPLFREDAFDCTTYVETVLARAISGKSDPLPILNHLRYRGGEIGFTTRNHFPEIDWIPNNIHAGFVREATALIAGREKTATAEALMNKRGWYEHLGDSALQVPGLDKSQREKLLEELHHEGAAFLPVSVKLDYVPAKEFDAELIDRIPSGTIFNLVRFDPSLEAKIGTQMLVSHQGFLIRVHGVLNVRHASPVPNQVTQEPLVEYLKRFNGSTTFKGLNLLEPKSASF